MTYAEDAEGFTLLETLIAFLILATVLAISAQTIAIAAKSLSRSRERADVLRLADVLHAETLPGIFQTWRDAEGISKSFRWKIDVTPLVKTDALAGRAGFAVITISPPSGGAQRFVYFSSDSRRRE